MSTRSIFLLEDINGFHEFESVIGDGGGWLTTYKNRVQRWPAPLRDSRHNVLMLMEPHDRHALFENDKYHKHFTDLTLTGMSKVARVLADLSKKVFPVNEAGTTDASSIVRQSVRFLCEDRSSKAVLYIRRICLSLVTMPVLKRYVQSFAKIMVADVLAGKRGNPSDSWTRMGFAIFDIPHLTTDDQRNISILFGLLRGFWDVCATIQMKQLERTENLKRAYLSVGIAHAQMIRRLMNVDA